MNTIEEVKAEIEQLKKEHQKQPVELDEEIDRFLANATPITKGENKGKYVISRLGFKTVARHFAQWQKEQMMKEAVEGTVMDFSSNLPRPQVDVLLDPHKYHTGDKVKLIIVKEG